MVYFCGYPVVNDSPGGAVYKPCGKHATPGCAFCDEHAQYPERRELTEQDIVDRVAGRIERERMITRRLAVWGAAALLVLVALLRPVHTFLHAHLESFAGVLVGTLLQSVPWAIDRWRWLKWFGHQ